MALALLAANALALQGLTFLGAPLLAAKILVELALIPVSFSAQKRWVFANQHPAAPAVVPESERKAGADSGAPSPTTQPEDKLAQERSLLLKTA